MKSGAILLLLAVVIALPACGGESKKTFRAAASADALVYDVQTARDIVTMVNDNWQDRVSSYSDNFTYQDEIISVQGKENMETYLEGLFNNMNINIDIVDEAISARTYIATWSQTMEIALLPGHKKSFLLEGVSVLRYGSDGKLNSQRDYYNEADIYVELPVMHSLITFFRNMTKRKYLGVAE